MDEGNVRTTVLSALRPLHAIYVENGAKAGTGDVNYIEGWLELKWLHNWPKRPKTPIKLPEFTPQQRLFLIERCRMNGQARVLLRVGREWILLPGMWSAFRLGKTSTRADILAAAEKHWLANLSRSELVSYLRDPPPVNSDWSSFLKESGYTFPGLERASINTLLQLP